MKHYQVLKRLTECSVLEQVAYQSEEDILCVSKQHKIENMLLIVSRMCIKREEKQTESTSDGTSTSHLDSWYMKEIIVNFHKIYIIYDIIYFLLLGWLLVLGLYKEDYS